MSHRVKLALPAVLLMLAGFFVPSIVMADGNLVPLDGSQAGIKPSDFGYRIETSIADQHVNIVFILSSTAAKSFGHADLSLIKAGKTLVEAPLGLTLDGDKRGRMSLKFDRRSVDDGELVIWSDWIEGAPGVRDFAGFRVSVAKLLAQKKEEAPATKPAVAPDPPRTDEVQQKDAATGQPAKAAQGKLGLAARIEVDEHEHCFSVRFFLKNDSDRDVEVMYGRGRAGLEVVPTFSLGSGRDQYITPPTYLGPARRSLEPNLMPIPAGKEILYGTFTMGYPRREKKESSEELSATIHFQGSTEIFTAKPVRLKIPAHEPAAKGTVGATRAPDDSGEWVPSENGDLSLRLRAKSTRIATQDSIFFVAEIRNNRPEPVTILRPFGDAYVAEASQVKIWGEQGQIKYAGPKLDYDLNAKAFITIGPNEVVADTLELPVSHFAGTDKAGMYTLRFDYAYAGDWDKKVASEGVKGVWHGAICSREIQVQKK